MRLTRNGVPSRNRNTASRLTSWRSSTTWSARTIEEQVRGGLERIADQIGALYGGDAAEHEQAVSLASEFREQVRGLDLARRVEAYCR